MIKLKSGLLPHDGIGPDLNIMVPGIPNWLALTWGWVALLHLYKCWVLKIFHFTLQFLLFVEDKKLKNRYPIVQDSRCKM